MSDRTTSAASRANQGRDQIAVIVSTVDGQRAKYEGLLPSTVPWDRFRNAFLVAVQSNWRLLEADRQSLWLALQKAAGDGLLPDGRESALVIFGDETEDEDGNPVPSQAKGQKKVVYMPMVAGLIKLVRNTGMVTGIRAKLIYRGERVVVTDEDGRESYRHVREIDADSRISDDPGNIIGAYAVVNYRDGTWEMEAMTRHQIDRVKAVSRAKKGPWLPWYDEMARKTVMRRLIKRLEKSAEMQHVTDAIDRDETLGPEIEGEKPVEVGHQGQIGQDIIRHEFTGGRTSRDPEPVQRTQPRQEPPEDRRAPPSEPAQTRQNSEAPAGKPASPPAPAASPPPEGGPPQPPSGNGADMELWAMDEIGEPLDRPEPMTAMEFARWFADAYDKASNPLALWEHNADAIGDASVAPEARRIISEARAVRDAASAQQTAAANQAPTAREPVKVPVTGKNAPHWPNYGEACAAEIAGLPTVADLDGWVQVNQPTYKDKAIEIKIERRVAARRAELEALVPGASPPPEDDGFPGDAPLIGTDEQIEASLLASAGRLATENDLIGWTKLPSIQATMSGLRVRNRPAWTRVCEAIDQRRVEIGGAS